MATTAERRAVVLRGAVVVAPEGGIQVGREVFGRSALEAAAVPRYHALPELLPAVLAGGRSGGVRMRGATWTFASLVRRIGPSSTNAASFEDHDVEPELPATEGTAADLLSAWSYSLAVIDAAAGAHSLQGLDDNKRSDVEAFTHIYVRSFWLQGVVSRPSCSTTSPTTTAPRCKAVVE